MTTAAPSPAPAPVPTTSPQQPKAPTAQPEAPPQKLRLRGIHGDEEREYDPKEVAAWAQRGLQVSKIMSHSEKRAQEADKKEAETEARLAKLKSKNMGEVRAALRELGVETRGLAEIEVQDYLKEKELTPEQRRIRELEAEQAKHKETEAQAKKRREAEEEDAEVQRHADELSNLFLDVAESIGLPRSSAQPTFPRLALMHQTAAKAGVKLSPEVAGERLKAQLAAEHKMLFYKKTEQGEALDLDALKSWFTPEDWKAIRKEAVDQWKAKRTAPAASVTQAAPAPTPMAKRQPAGENFWRALDKRTR